MSLIDSLPANGTAAPAPGAAPAPSPASGGGLLDSLPVNKSYQAPAPATPPNAGSPTPIDWNAISMHDTLPPSPAMQPANNKFMPTQQSPYFATTDARGVSWGPSDQKDTSGLPYMSYKRPTDTSTTTDTTRVDTAFDPRIAAPITQGSFTTPRAVANRAAVKSAMGGTASDELDHTIALELAGSNNQSNLRIEPFVKGTQNTATDPLENQLAKAVISGQASLFQAQFDLAKAKGTQVPYIGDVANKYAELAYDAKKSSDYANSPLGIAENSAGTIKNWATSLASTVLDHVKASVSSPQGALQTGEGAVQTGLLKPASFAEGIGYGILNAENTGLNAITGKKEPGISPEEGVFHQLNQMNSTIPRSPEEQKAFDTGQFVGWIAPYSGIAKGVNVAADASKIGQLAPKLAPLIPYISDAAGFLGTGQILHTPDEGTRFQQLKSDAIALALFDVGGFALKGGGVMVAKKLGTMLAPETKQAATAALEPVVSAIKEGGTVSADALDHATTQANSIIENATGHTPQELLQEHLGVKSPAGGEATTAHAAMTESGARSYVKNNYEQMKQDYQKLVTERYGTPNVVSADEAKEVIPGYNGTNAADYHEASADFRDKYYNDLLQSEKGKGNNTVLYTSGATGVGKTSALREIGVANKDHPITYDSNLNGSSSPGKFKSAIDNGYNVRVVHSHRDPIESFTNGVLPRTQSTGRIVSIDEHAGRHMAVPDNVDTLHAQQAIHGPERFQVIHVDKTGAPGTGKVIPIDKIPQFDYNGLHERLHEELNKAEKSGVVSSEQARAIRGGGTEVRTENGGQAERSGDQGSITRAQADSIRGAGAENNADNRGEPKTERQQGSGKEIELADFPNKSRPLFGVAFPGANYIGRFIEKDIIEKFSGVRDAVTGIYKASKDLFTPNVGKEKAAAIVGSGLMKVEKYASAAWKVAENRRDWWANMSESDHYDFIDKMETGNATFDMFDRYSVGVQHTMQDLADEYRNRLNATFHGEADAGVKHNYIEDYFPHMWEDPAAAKDAFQQYTQSLGKGYFTNLRTIDLIKIGREFGLKLKTSNPEELVLMREIDGQRVGAKIDMMHELQGEGLARPITGVQSDGQTANWPIVNGSDGKQYAVTPDAKKILDNAFFEKSLWSKPGVMGTMFRSIMAVKGMVTPIKLSLSLFHPIHIAFIDSSSERARVWEGLIKGNMSAGDALSTLGKSTTFASQFSDVHDHWNIAKLWDKPMDQLTDTQRTQIQHIIEGGGTPKMSEEFKIRANDGYKKALADENYIGAAIRGFPKLIEGYQKPIFETYIPALKIGSYLKGTAELLKNNPELATNDVARKVAFRNLWKSMDNRFGQMVYKTTFWNPMLKEVGQASFLSLGWNAGFVREFGGGALDLAKLATKLAGKPLGLAKPTLDDVTQKMLFSIDYTIQAALVGGIMTYAMSGKMPQGAQDLFFPNTGKTNPDGSAARLNTSFYTREYFGIVNHMQKQGAIGGSVATVQNKMSPVLNSLADIFNNKDFYGYQIHDTNQNPAKQAEQVLAYLMQNNLLPISTTGAQNAAPTTGVLGQALSYAGFNPAPKYIAETPMQTQIYSVLDQRTGGTKPLDAKPAADAKANIRKLYETGNIDGANKALDAAVQAGYIKPSGRTTFISSLDLPGDVRAFKSLAQFPSDQEHLLSQMSEQDLARYANYANSTTKSHLSSLSPTAKKFVQDLQSGKIKLDSFKAGKVVPPTTQ